MPLPRIFSSAAAKDWVSPLIVVSKGLVPMGNCAPVPYVAAALGAGLALLELIQMVHKSSDDLIYLAESVVTIMKLLRDEMDSHATGENQKFRELCMEFQRHLTQISKDLESMSKNWSSSKFKKYLNSHNIRDRIALFTRQVDDLRANATLIAATGTRMDLASVAKGVAALQVELLHHRSSLSKPSAECVLHDLTRYEEDFHALKLGDIHLEFETARRTHVVEWDYNSPGKRHIVWTDYKATVKGSTHTVRVYEGSDSSHPWNDFLSFLADNSPSPHLPQLFGFCASPRLRSLVFHGEFCTPDEYAATLPTAEAIVEWELNVMSDVCQLEYRLRPLASALVDLRANGKIIISHINGPSDFQRRHDRCEPFLNWVASLFPEDHLRIEGPHDSNVKRAMLHRLRSLVALGREARTFVISPPLVNIFETLNSRGAVHHRRGGVLARLPGRQMTVDDAWGRQPFAHTYYRLPERSGSPQAVFRSVFRDHVGLTGLPWLDTLYPRVVNEPKHDSTQLSIYTVMLQGLIVYFSFVVPLLGGRLRCGYCLDAEIEFGRLVPNIFEAWLAQASSIVSLMPGSSPEHFIVPHKTNLQLHWEMVPEGFDLPTSPEAQAILDALPEEIHVFVQVPILGDGTIDEPQIYWSTDADTIKTNLIPHAALKIRMRYYTAMSVPRWEPHHYKMAEKIQLDNGFDPTTTMAAEYLGLPILDVVGNQSNVTPSAKQDTPLSQNPLHLAAVEKRRSEDRDNWCKYCEKDPHTMQELVRYPYGPPILQHSFFAAGSVGPLVQEIELGGQSQ
ncbi:hypothetical protein C8R46DRAFT_1351220 [Mycena filopes]|nr:hypothetical protein C8R46DRAFT_1351220 [Mycena filopes]